MDRNRYHIAGSTFLALASLFVGFLFVPLTAHGAGDLIYDNSATTTANTSGRFQTVVDCDVVDSTISEMWFWYSDRNVNATSTLTIDSVTYSTYHHPVNNTSQWHHLVFTSDFDCTAGVGQVLVEMAGNVSGAYSVRGSTGFNTTQVSGTIYASNGITVSTTSTKVALRIYSGDTLVVPRVFSFPEPVFQGKIRVATTTCTNTDTTADCVTYYTPEYYYHDWLLVQLVIIFLLSFTVYGFFFNRTHTVK